MIKNKLLANIFFGTELDKLPKGTAATQKILFEEVPEFRELSNKQWNALAALVKGFFHKPLYGQFGGPITAGDAFFIASYLAAFRPKSMIEIGVCSGVSSSFILYAAHKLGLTNEGRVFLHSLDLLRFHGSERLEVGRVVDRNYPSLKQFWKLHAEVTAPELALDLEDVRAEISDSSPTLAFIDANHMHPWPVVDVISMSEILPSGSWLLLQDTQLMERWLANSVELGVPTPRPCRGVNLVTTLWPGTKIVGWDICYNMGSIRLDVSDEELKSFVTRAFRYPSETGEVQSNQCAEYVSRLLHLGKS